MTQFFAFKITEICQKGEIIVEVLTAVPTKTDSFKEILNLKEVRKELRTQELQKPEQFAPAHIPHSSGRSALTLHPPLHGHLDNYCRYPHAWRCLCDPRCTAAIFFLNINGMPWQCILLGSCLASSFWTREKQNQDCRGLCQKVKTFNKHEYLKVHGLCHLSGPKTLTVRETKFKA